MRLPRGTKRTSGREGVKKRGQRSTGTMCNVQSKVYYHVLCNAAPCTTTIQICNKNKQTNKQIGKDFCTFSDFHSFFFFLYCFKNTSRVGADGPARKSMCFSCRVLVLIPFSAPTCGGLQLPVSPAPWDPMPFSRLCGHLDPTHYPCICTSK